MSAHSGHSLPGDDYNVESEVTRGCWAVWFGTSHWAFDAMLVDSALNVKDTEPLRVGTTKAACAPGMPGFNRPTCGLAASKEMLKKSGRSKQRARVHKQLLGNHANAAIFGLATQVASWSDNDLSDESDMESDFDSDDEDQIGHEDRTDSHSVTEAELETLKSESYVHVTELDLEMGTEKTLSYWVSQASYGASPQDDLPSWAFANPTPNQLRSITSVTSTRYAAKKYEQDICEFEVRDISELRVGVDTTLTLKRDVCCSCFDDDNMGGSSGDEYTIHKRTGKNNRKLRNKTKADDFAARLAKDRGLAASYEKSRSLSKDRSGSRKRQEAGWKNYVETGARNLSNKPVNGRVVYRKADGVTKAVTVAEDFAAIPIRA